jgi:DNA invertase Pin-like site-specific DNA recombinase
MPQMLLPLFPADATSINELVGFCRRDDFVYYFNGQMPIFSHHVNDLKSFRLITSQLVLVRAFRVSKISVKRYVKRYREEGAEGFFKPRKVRSSAVLTAEVLNDVQKCLAEGQPVSLISKEMGLKADTLNKAIRDGRLHRNKKKTPLPPPSS